MVQVAIRNVPRSGGGSLTRVVEVPEGSNRLVVSGDVVVEAESAAQVRGVIGANPKQLDSNVEFSEAVAKAKAKYSIVQRQPQLSRSVAFGGSKKQATAGQDFRSEGTKARTKEFKERVDARQTDSKTRAARFEESRQEGKAELKVRNQERGAGITESQRSINRSQRISTGNRGISIKQQQTAIETGRTGRKLRSRGVNTFLGVPISKGGQDPVTIVTTTPTTKGILGFKKTTSIVSASAARQAIQASGQPVPKQNILTVTEGSYFKKGSKEAKALEQGQASPFVDFQYDIKRTQTLKNEARNKRISKELGFNTGENLLGRVKGIGVNLFEGVKDLFQGTKEVIYTDIPSQLNRTDVVALNFFEAAALERQGYDAQRLICLLYTSPSPRDRS